MDKVRDMFAPSLLSESQQHVFQTFGIIFEGFEEVALACFSNVTLVQIDY